MWFVYINFMIFQQSTFTKFTKFVGSKKNEIIIFLAIQFDMNLQELSLLWIAVFMTVYAARLEANTILGRFTEIIYNQIK